MADADFLEDGAAGFGNGRFQQIVTLTGAVVSVGLVVGLGFWGYKLAMRDVTGIPVVRALDTPMRIAPTDPGGEIAGNLGLSVNAIAGDDMAAPPPDQLVLAPRPVDLTDDDLPAGQTGGLTAPADPTASAGTGPVALSVPADTGAAIVAPAPVEMPTRTVLAPAADGPDVSEEGALDPLADPAEAAVTEAGPEVTPPAPEEIAAPVPDTAPAPPGAVLKSPRPMARPTETVVLASLAPVAAEPVAAASTPPATIRAGTRLVQLGAFDNAADAIAEWDRLTARFGDLVADKSRVIQDAQSGGRNFVRLRAMGFADEADARRFCSALLSENAACIPVSQR